MRVTTEYLREKVRKALDDIMPTAIDTFAEDVNAEIDQALVYAADSLSRTLPTEQIEASVVQESPSLTKGTRAADGSGYIVLPSDFLKFISLRMTGWKGTVSELLEPGGDLEKQQRSIWSRGTATKPKAMLDTGGTAANPANILRYWPHITDDTLDTLLYARKASITGDYLECAIKDECEKNLVYMACRLFLEGKKESQLAESFTKLTTI